MGASASCATSRADVEKPPVESLPRDRRDRRGVAGERGQVVVLFALLLPVFFALASIVITLGNWFVHARHLQTKADAAAFAAGTVWSTPCDATIDARIEETARTYVGPHMKADGTPYAGTTYNPQVGGVDGSQIHVVLNGSEWYDDDSNPAPLERNDPLNPSICEARILDVKVTEDNSFPLFSLIPLFPDIKRKARIEIQETEGITDLVPFAPRFPAPASAAAVFYDESNGVILAGGDAVRFFTPRGLTGMPAGLEGYSTWDDEWATIQIPVSGRVGVVIATSNRPACETGVATPCFEDEGFTTVDELCNQNGGRLILCFYTGRSGATQTVRSGLHFIRGFPAGSVPPGPNIPDVRGAWLSNISCRANGYFNTNAVSDCAVELHVDIDAGSCMRGVGAACFDDTAPDPPEESRKAPDVEVRYCLVRAGDAADVCLGQFGVDQDLDCSGSGNISCVTTPTTHLQIEPDSRVNAVAIQVRLRNTRVTGFDDCEQGGTFLNTCRFFFTGNGYFGDSLEPTATQVLSAPIQRAFMGIDDPVDPTEIVSGPIGFVRLTSAVDPDDPLTYRVDWDAASHPIGETRSFHVDLGLIPALAQSQSDTPVAIKLTGSGSQRAIVDCNWNDPADPFQPARDRIDKEIVRGCTSFFTANDFTRDPPCDPLTGENHYFLSPPGAGPGPAEPWASEWPPITCVFTKTGNFPEFIKAGFEERLFDQASPPGPYPTNLIPPALACPSDLAGDWVKGRNYWSDANNMNDEFTFPNFNEGDPRRVTVFFTAYDAFTGGGNKQEPIVGFGIFYITGWGKLISPGGPGGPVGSYAYYRRLGIEAHDPCPGFEPPPSLRGSSSVTGSVVWGHYVEGVVEHGGPSGRLCPGGEITPCVAVLVE